MMNLKSVILISLNLVIFILFINNLNASNKIYDESKKPSLPFKKDFYKQQSSYDSRQDAKALESISEGPLKKFCRGLSNITFGFLEILKQPYKVNKQEGGLAGLTYGLGKGIFYFIAREGTGIIEIITFPMPLPGAAKSKYKTGWGYGPLMQPEWIFSLKENPYNFIYPDYPAQ